MNTRCDAEPDQPVFHHANHPHPGAKPVTLNCFEPHTAHRSGIGLVPDAPPFIHVRLLFAPGPFRVHGVGNADGNPVLSPQAVFGQFVGEGCVLTQMNFLIFNGAEGVAIEPDAGFVATGAKGKLHHGALRRFTPLRKGEFPFVPGHHLIVPAGRHGLVFGLGHVRFNGAGPQSGGLVRMAHVPPLVQAPYHRYRGKISIRHRAAGTCWAGVRLWVVH